MNREKAITIGKKLLLIFLRIAGCLALFVILGTASDFLCQIQVDLYGVAGFVGSRNVIYVGDLWEYIYTNPVAMMGRALLNSLAVSMGVLLLSALAVWGVQKGKLFPRFGKCDKFLIAALFISLVTSGFCGWISSAAEEYCSRQYDKVKACQTLADYEKNLGRPFFDEIIQKTDREWIKTLGSFERSECIPDGFVPGRRLVIFGMERPRVYILLWMDNGKVVQRNGCYQNIPLPQKKGASNGHP